MTTIKKILCAIDLTKASRNAFDRALSIARVSNARLYILHAVPANNPFSWHATRTPRASDKAAATCRARRRTGSDSSSNTAIPRGSSCCMPIPGKPTSSSLDRTGGAAGSGSEQGSVGERVLRRAAWAVLIVPWDVPSRRRAEALRDNRPTLATCGRTSRRHWLLRENARSLRQLERDAE